MTWQDTARAKRESLLAKIPAEWRLEHIPDAESHRNARIILDELLPPDEKAITALTVAQLAKAIAAEKLTPTQVTRAFCHRAALAHQLVNCCSEIFFEQAFERARQLEEYYAKTGKLIGPLHGIPISLKDQFNLEGIETSLGYVSLVGHPVAKKDETYLATLLRDAGAIFFVKTTVPMALMAPETYSNIHGHTLNSVNRLLSAGGSSGGEASLVAAGGAPIGFGTDIGGSVRIPAGFHGLYGLRPSSGRLPYCRIANSMAFQPVLPSVVGPMAPSLDDIELITKLIVQQKPWLHDPKCYPVPWTDVASELRFETLSIGVMRWNGLVMPHPPILRAIDKAVGAIESAGHYTRPWSPPVTHSELVKATMPIYSADGYQEIIETCAIAGEPILSQLVGVPDEPNPISVKQHWGQAEKKFELQVAYDEYWNGTAEISGTQRPLDAWISPMWETASFVTDHDLSHNCSYTCPINLLDYTAITVPVTTVNKDIDLPDLAYKPISERDRKVHDFYDPAVFHGAPVAIQIITRRYEEEKAIFIAGILRDAMKAVSSSHI